MSLRAYWAAQVAYVAQLALDDIYAIIFYNLHNVGLTEVVVRISQCTGCQIYPWKSHTQSGTYCMQPWVTISYPNSTFEPLYLHATVDMTFILRLIGFTLTWFTYKCTCICSQLAIISWIIQMYCVTNYCIILSWFLLTMQCTCIIYIYTGAVDTYLIFMRDCVGEKAESSYAM